MASKVRIEYTHSAFLPIDLLKDFQGNLKSLSNENYAKLKAQILDLGFSEPISVWENEGLNYILNGHQRLRTLTQMRNEGIHIPEIPVNYIIAKDKAEAARKVLALTSQYGEMDTQGLYEFSEANDIHYEELESRYRFPEIDLDKYKDEFYEELGAGLTDEDEVPEVKETNVKLGDIYNLGNHRLMCADSTDKLAVAKLMNGEKADMVFTDPPYELETKGGGLFQESKAMKKIAALSIDKFEPSSLQSYAETSIYCCNKPLISKYIELAEKWDVSWDLAVYHKQNITPNYGGHLMTDLEYLMVIGRQAPNTGIGEDKSLYSKLFSGGKDADNETPWSKPVALCEKFIKLFSKRSVLDHFLGSGSTLIACEKTNRKCYGMEIDPQYCQVVIDRWQNFTGKKALIAGG